MVHVVTRQKEKKKKKISHSFVVLKSGYVFSLRSSELGRQASGGPPLGRDERKQTNSKAANRR